MTDTTTLKEGERILLLEKQVHALAQALIELGHVHANHVHLVGVSGAMGGLTQGPEDMR